MDNIKAIPYDHYKFLQKVFEAGYVYSGSKASEGFDQFLKQEIKAASSLVKFFDQINSVNSQDHATSNA